MEPVVVDLVKMAREQGRKDVIEWQESQWNFDVNAAPFYVMDKKVWEAQKKVWGL